MKLSHAFLAFASTVTGVEVTTAPSVTATTNAVELTTNQYEEDDAPPGLPEGMQEMMCSLANYNKLAANNPEDYPAMGERRRRALRRMSHSPKLRSRRSTESPTCIHDDMTFHNCDCSSPETFNYENDSVCGLLEAMSDGSEGADKFISLACGTSSVVLDGTDTDGTVTDGTVTDGTVTDVTDTHGTVTDEPATHGIPGVDIAKMMCNNVIYAILANDDPYEYPLGGPMSKPISKAG